MIIPPFLEVAGDVTGCTVLDAGCGEGVVSRLLAERGAVVTGVDVASRAECTGDLADAEIIRLLIP